MPGRNYERRHTNVHYFGVILPCRSWDAWCDPRVAEEEQDEDRR